MAVVALEEDVEDFHPEEDIVEVIEAEVGVSTLTDLVC